MRNDRFVKAAAALFILIALLVASREFGTGPTIHVSLVRAYEIS